MIKEPPAGRPGQVLVVSGQLLARAGHAAAHAAVSTVCRHGAVLAVDQSGPSRTLRCRLQVQVVLNTHDPLVAERRLTARAGSSVQRRIYKRVALVDTNTGPRPGCYFLSLFHASFCDCQAKYYGNVGP